MRSHYNTHYMNTGYNAILNSKEPNNQLAMVLGFMRRFQRQITFVFGIIIHPFESDLGTGILTDISKFNIIDVSSLEEGGGTDNERRLSETRHHLLFTILFHS